jgi:hypothetical protein
MVFKWLREPGYPPALLVCPARLPGRLIGLSLGPVIVVERAYAKDHPTLLHELEHSRQFWTGGLLLHFFRYWCSKRYRLTAEINAYALELGHCEPKDREQRLLQAAHALSQGYNLAIEPGACITLLRAKLAAAQTSQD